MNSVNEKKKKSGVFRWLLSINEYKKGLLSLGVFSYHLFYLLILFYLFFIILTTSIGDIALSHSFMELNS